MAYSAQGCKIQRQGTAAGATCKSTGISLQCHATLLERTTAPGAGGFIVDGFTTGMRVWIDSTDPNNGGYTVHTVAASVLGILETLTESNTFIGSVYGAAMTDIGEVTQFSVPSGSPSIIDISHLQSTAKEKMIGMIDEGQMTFGFNYQVATQSTASTDSLHMVLQTDRKNRTKRTFDVLLTDYLNSTDATAVPSKALFDGYVTGFSLSGAVDGKVEGNVTIEIDGEVRWSMPGS